MLHKLQYISQGNTISEQEYNIGKALDGGCSWIQLRFKNGVPDDLVKAAKIIKHKCLAYNATFIINDHVQVAKDFDADGVHLCLSDMNVLKARCILGKDKIIGGTANTYEDVLQRIGEGCDYIGLGPLRFTTTKEKLSPILGLNGYQSVMTQLLQEQKFIAVYAIGGIREEDISALMKTGIYGVAVSGAITGSCDAKKLIGQINHQLYEYVTNS